MRRVIVIALIRSLKSIANCSVEEITQILSYPILYIIIGIWLNRGLSFTCSLASIIKVKVMSLKLVFYFLIYNSIIYKSRSYFPNYDFRICKTKKGVRKTVSLSYLLSLRALKGYLTLNQYKSSLWGRLASTEMLIYNNVSIGEGMLFAPYKG